MKHFMFGTGIECSMPKVKDGLRRDILQETGHYEHYRREFELCRRIGVRYLRYGVPYYQIHTGPDTYDWSLTDKILPTLKEKGLVPILDLCHYGLPDWLGDFQNPAWPEHFAQFARCFAERYSWIQYYTPINEMFVLAKFNGRDGLWNERLKSDEALVKGMLNTIRGTHLAIAAILEVNPTAVFIPCEAAEIFHEQWPSTRDRIHLENALIYATYDLLFGHTLEPEALTLFQQYGFEQDEYDFFLQRGAIIKPHSIMGLNYFAPSERVLLPDGGTAVSPAAIGWNELARRLYDRHQMPFMLSETNNLGRGSEAGPEWLWKMWNQIAFLRDEGLPAVGLIWYSLRDQYDWDSLLQEKRHTNIPVGLYTLDFKKNPVEADFRRILERYAETPILPTITDKRIPSYAKWKALSKGQ